MRSGPFPWVQTKGDKLRSARRRQMRPLQFPLQPLPPYVDLRPWMTPVEDQGQMESW